MSTLAIRVDSLAPLKKITAHGNHRLLESVAYKLARLGETAPSRTPMDVYLGEGMIIVMADRWDALLVQTLLHAAEWEAMGAPQWYS